MQADYYSGRARQHLLAPFLHLTVVNGEIILAVVRDRDTRHNRRATSSHILVFVAQAAFQGLHAQLLISCQSVWHTIIAFLAQDAPDGESRSQATVSAVSCSPVVVIHCMASCRSMRGR